MRKNTHSLRLPIALSVLLFVARVSSSRHHCRRSLAVPGLLGNTLSLSLQSISYMALSLSLYNIWPGRRAVPWRLRLGLAWPVYGLAGERFLAPAPWPGVACDPVYGLPACRRSCIWPTPWLGVAYGLSAGMLHDVCPCMI